MQIELLDQDPQVIAGEVSIIVPAYNEEEGIGQVLEQLCEVMRMSGWEYEILVVDDGSEDKTGDVASQYKDVTVLRHRKNRGYGAALKAGISKARAETIVIIDADGSYPSESIPLLLKQAEGYDMVVGARTTSINHTPLVRKPAKWFLRVLASYLAGQRLPDVNSGLRVMRKRLVQRFSHVLPSGFSFTTSITLALLCNDYLVHYQPIDYYPRKGRSKIRARDAYDFFLLILRTIVYFSPLRVFMPLGGLLFLSAVVKFTYDIGVVGIGKISAGVGLGILGAVIVWTLGLLADQIARIALAGRPE